MNSVLKVLISCLGMGYVVPISCVGMSVLLIAVFVQQRKKPQHDQLMISLQRHFLKNQSGTFRILHPCSFCDKKKQWMDHYLIWTRSIMWLISGALLSCIKLKKEKKLFWLPNTLGMRNENTHAELQKGFLKGSLFSTCL